MKRFESFKTFCLSGCALRFVHGIACRALNAVEDAKIHYGVMARGRIVFRLRVVALAL